jgi:hypothetical protein
MRNLKRAEKNNTSACMGAAAAAAAVHLPRPGRQATGALYRPSVPHPHGVALVRITPMIDRAVSIPISGVGSICVVRYATL